MQNLQTNDHYLGNVNVKRDGVKHQFTEDEVKEYVKCGKDPVYFCKKYLKVISLDDGLVPFELYPYQEKMFEHFNTQRFSIILACRQSGKSISSVGYLLWYACFHSEKTIAILANKGAVAREMLSRVTLMLENLPFFLQLGRRHSTKVRLSLVITVVLLPVLPLVVPLGVCLLIYYFLTSLHSWREQTNSTPRPTQLSPQVRILKSSLQALRMELETLSTKSGKGQRKE